MAKGMPPEKACEQLSKKLTASLLHHPTLGLRDMIERSDGPTLACLAARLEKKHESVTDRKTRHISTALRGLAY